MVVFLKEYASNDCFFLVYIYFTRSIPIWVNKLTSTATLSPIDYSELPLCFSLHSTATDVDSVPFAPIAPTSSWQGAMQSWHGDALYELEVGGIVGLQVLREEYCASMASCLDDLDNHDDVVEAWKNAVIHQYEYNVVIDGLPAVLREEDEYVSIFVFWKRTLTQHGMLI
jgi:hypothetical protein